MPAPDSVSRQLDLGRRVDHRAASTRRARLRAGTSFTSNPRQSTGPSTSTPVVRHQRSGQEHGADPDATFSLYSTDGGSDSGHRTKLANRQEEAIASEVDGARQQLEHLDVILRSLNSSRTSSGAGAAVHSDDPEVTLADIGNRSSSPRPSDRETRRRRHRSSSSDRSRTAKTSDKSPRMRDAEAREIVSRAEEDLSRRFAQNEEEQQQRQTHIATCLTSLHCLVGELKEIFVVRGVVAPGEDPKAAESEDGVVHQLFSDINRLLRATAFGADGTFESGDSLTAATLLENRRLRAEVQGKERELTRHRSTIEQLSKIRDGVEDADRTIHELKQEQAAATNKAAALEHALLELARRHATDRDALEQFQRESDEFHTKARNWQAAVDAAVVETELMKSHTENLEAELVKARASEQAARDLANRKGSEVVALSRENLLLEAKIADLARELETSRSGLRALAQHRTHPTIPSASGPTLGTSEWDLSTQTPSKGQRQTVSSFLQHDARQNEKQGWESIVGELETDRRKAHDELAQIDGEIVSLQQSLQELTGGLSDVVSRD